METLDTAAPRGLFFEDFEIGKQYVTPRRTVTSTDIVNFSCLSGDFNAPHIDHLFCASQPYKEPIAHAPLVLAIGSGLQCLSGMNDGTVVAMLGMDEWRMHLPVKSGDTLYMVVVPIEKRLTSGGDKGIISLRREIKNQRGEVVQSMVTKLLYKARSSKSD
jgi:acyl dehydratase